MLLGKVTRNREGDVQQRRREETPGLSSVVTAKLTPLFSTSSLPLTPPARQEARHLTEFTSKPLPLVLAILNSHSRIVSTPGSTGERPQARPSYPSPCPPPPVLPQSFPAASFLISACPCSRIFVCPPSLFWWKQAGL